jgi:hypothetical protein
MARLVQLGICQSRYFGRTKTRLPVVMAAGVANVSLAVGYRKRPAEQVAKATQEVALAGPLAAVLALWRFCRRNFVRHEPAWA